MFFVIVTNIRVGNLTLYELARGQIGDPERIKKAPCMYGGEHMNLEQAKCLLRCMINVRLSQNVIFRRDLTSEAKQYLTWGLFYIL